jgi:hypothetical protein
VFVDRRLTTSGYFCFLFHQKENLEKSTRSSWLLMGRCFPESQQEQGSHRQYDREGGGHRKRGCQGYAHD